MRDRLTQKERLLAELKLHPVNSYYATYELRIKQAPTRIQELQEEGYPIESVRKPNRSVDWVLKEKPKETTTEEFAQWIKKRQEEEDKNKPQTVLF